MSFPQHALALGVALGRRPGHTHRDGFLHSLFATSPWLGGIVVAALVGAGVVLAILRRAGRMLGGFPWYVRLGMVAAAVFGIRRLMNRNRPGGA